MRFKTWVQRDLCIKLELKGGTRVLKTQVPCDNNLMWKKIHIENWVFKTWFLVFTGFLCSSSSSLYSFYSCKFLCSSSSSVGYSIHLLFFFNFFKFSSSSNSSSTWQKNLHVSNQNSRCFSPTFFLMCAN